MAWRLPVSPRRSTLLLAASLLAVAAAAPLGATLADPAPGHPGLAASVGRAFGAPVEPLATQPWTLREAVQAWDARLGVHRAPGALDVLDGLDPALAAPAARLLAALHAAQLLRDAAAAGVADAEILAVTGTHGPEAQAVAARIDRAAMLRAALGLAAAVEEVLPALQAHRAALLAAQAPGAGARGPAAEVVAGPPLVDLPPVLVMDPLLGDTVYRRDAVLTLDVGGNDVYDHNAGGSILSIGLIDTDPSTCQLNLGFAAIGCEMHDTAAAVTAALNLDLGGDDTYGVYEPPRPGGRDARCTTQPIVRRVVIQGAASGGIGMLVDAQGNDQYHGKTLAQSNGHVAGVGMLFDLLGDDTYRVLREGPGTGALGGYGFFQEAAGNDQYLHVSPAGGIWNADTGRCDASERFGLAAAIIAGTGHFEDLAGDDVYRVRSQAFGDVDANSAATFLDAAGSDDYGGFPGRGNGMALPGQATFVDV